MNEFLKASAGILTALILWLSLTKYNKENSVLLTLAVCAMVISVSLAFLQPIIDFLRTLQNMGELDTDLISVVLKAVGIGLISEISALVCKDAGNESMGKALQLLSSILVLWMSIPVFEKLLTLLDNVLGSV